MTTTLVKSYADGTLEMFSDSLTLALKRQVETESQQILDFLNTGLEALNARIALRSTP